jgi:long-chain acyl-CoA synthetase
MITSKEINMTLSTLISDRAAKVPERICIKFKKNKITFSELDMHVNLASGGMRKTGFNALERAAILMDNCPEYIISYFAILRSGGTAVPINNFLTAEEIAYILRDSGCSLLIYGRNYSDRAREVKRKIPGIKILTFEEIPRATAEPCSGKGSDVAVLLYTSGTTGFPKGVMLTHNNLLSDAQACADVINFTPQDRVLLFLPLFHSFSFTVCVLVPLYACGRIILLESVKPFSRVINSIFRERITLFIAVPTVYNILVKKKFPFFIKYIFKYLINIRACISGASALPESTLRAFEKRFNIPLLEGYGLTEASPVVAVNPLKGIRKPCSVGPPIPGIEVASVREDGGETDAGEPGELIIRGPNVMKGYFNREKDTAGVLKDGWLYTGDIVKLDRDGYIYIIDRKKDLIIIDGMNVYPREIEDMVMKNPSVEECAMVGIPDKRGSEISILFIRRKENVLLDEDEIRKDLKGRVAQFKIPRRIIFIENFPKTATGKIKKKELRQWEI